MGKRRKTRETRDDVGKTGECIETYYGVLHDILTLYKVETLSNTNLVASRPIKRKKKKKLSFGFTFGAKKRTQNHNSLLEARLAGFVCEFIVRDR